MSEQELGRKAPLMNNTGKTVKSAKPAQGGKLSPENQTSLNLQQALDLAVQHHTEGDLSKAENVYQQILLQTIGL